MTKFKIAEIYNRKNDMIVRVYYNVDKEEYEVEEQPFKEWQLLKCKKVK